MAKGLFFAYLIALPLVSVVAQPTDVLRARIAQTKDDSLKSTWMAELAYRYLTDMKLDSALLTAEQGRDLARMGNHLIPEILNHEIEGQYYYYTGNYEACVQTFQATRLQAEKCGQPGIAARALSMLGWVNVDLRRFSEAKQLFGQADDIFKANKILGEDLAINYYGFAAAYSYQYSATKDIWLAKAYYDSALRLNPGLASRERAFVLAELGYIARVHDGDLGRSVQYLQAASQLAGSLSNNEDLQAYATAELATSHLRMGQSAIALAEAHRAKELYQRANPMRRVPATYELLADVFRASRRFREAFDMERANRLLSDSVINRRNLFVAAETHERFQTQQKQAALEQMARVHALEKTQITQERAIAIGVALACACVLLLVATILVVQGRYQRRLKASEMESRLKEERERISRDLHDNIGAQLASISWGLQRLLRETTSHHLVKTLQEHADRAMSDLRDTLWVIDKRSVSLEEFEQRINTLFWHYRKMETPVRLEMKMTSDIAHYQLPPTMAIQLYRVVQEAVQNTMKHSGATHLLVALQNGNRELKLNIRDNGKGFVWPLPDDVQHHGLKNMQRRAHQMKGTFAIDTAPNEGTHLNLKVKLPDFL